MSKFSRKKNNQQWTNEGATLNRFNQVGKAHQKVLSSTENESSRNIALEVLGNPGKNIKLHYAKSCYVLLKQEKLLWNSTLPHRVMQTERHSTTPGQRKDAHIS